MLIYIVLGCIAYLFNRGIDASQANLLKKAFLISACFQCQLEDIAINKIAK